MTTNQTIDGVFISRQLAERLTKTWYETDARNELRALLDAPDRRDMAAHAYGLKRDATELWNPNHDVANLAALLIELARHGIKVSGGKGDEPWTVQPSAKPQVVPVAWLYERPLHVGAQIPNVLCIERAHPDDLGGWIEKPLYAEPPAPVAVVLPERKP